MVKVVFSSGASRCFDNMMQATKVLPLMVKQYGKIDKILKVQADTCPECGSKIVFQEGCAICYSCGFAKCS